MKKLIVASFGLITCVSLGGVVHACDMHGGGFMSFNSMHSATWTPYDPQVSTIDPAFADQSLSDDAFEEDIMARALSADRTYRQKAKPSFSNAAHSAAITAQIRFAKNKESQANAQSDKPSETKKAEVLNSDS